MTNYRIQHKIAALIVFAICCFIAGISFTAQPAGAYVFPRLISVVLVLFATWNLVRAVFGWAKVGETLRGREAFNLIPGILITLVVIFFAATFFGFYACAFLTILALSTVYDPTALSDAMGWGRRILVSACTVGVLYLLFSLVLQVQTPTGFLI